MYLFLVRYTNVLLAQESFLQSSKPLCALMEYAEPATHILSVFFCWYRYTCCQTHLGHSCFVLKLVAGSDQCSDAYVGQHHNQSDSGQLTDVS